MNFQRIVLLVAGVTLIIALLFIAFSLYFLQSKRKYPPVIGECPDYWELDEKNGKPICKNSLIFDALHKRILHGEAILSWDSA